VCEEFEISDKVFKIVADSAANNKCAFKNKLEAQDETNILAKMLAKQRKRELFQEKAKLIKEAEDKAVVDINLEIEACNRVVPSTETERPKTAAQLLLELDNDEDDETEEILDSDSDDEDSDEFGDSDCSDGESSRNVSDCDDDIGRCNDEINTFSEKLVSFLKLYKKW